MYTLNIESLDQESRGVAHRDGKTIFVDSALPGEVVEASPYRRKPSFEMAAAQAVLNPSSARVAPRCIHFSKCGGCSLQHFDWRAQVAAKQRILEEDLWHIGKVRPEHILPAIYGQAWGYRNRARLAVRHVPKKGGVLVGFHEKRSSFVADMTSCEVMPPFVSGLLKPLRELIVQLSIHDRLPQVEVAVGEGTCVLVLRVLQPLTAQDEALLHEFARVHGVCLYLQPQGPESAYPFHPEQEADLHYDLREFNLKIRFGPTEFTQVNHEINRVLVRRALNLLDPRPGERVADFFCGIGTFGLACARKGATVVGLEGSATLLERAGRNAAANGLENTVRFRKIDLFKLDRETVAALGRFDRILIDPPRDGAIELVKSLDADMPGRIVYVSCNPATLARDASVLVHARKYCMRAAGVVNMFPHTSHVESVAVFDRK